MGNVNVTSDTNEHVIRLHDTRRLVVTDEASGGSGVGGRWKDTAHDSFLRTSTFRTLQVQCERTPKHPQRIKLLTQHSVFLSDRSHLLAADYSSRTLFKVLFWKVLFFPFTLLDGELMCRQSDGTLVFLPHAAHQELFQNTGKVGSMALSHWFRRILPNSVTK